MLSKKIVKYIQSLTQKKFRDADGVFIAEGPKVVRELLELSNMKCRLICAEKSWLSQNQNFLKDLSPDQIHETDEHWLKSISQLKTPNQVVAVFEKKQPAKAVDLKGKLSLMLDDLQDPGNLGTIIRIADWFGIENIICSQNSVDCYNPKVVQSTMGSLTRVNILYVELEKFLKENSGIKVYAATLSGTPIFKLSKITGGIILIGNESKGIHEDLLKHKIEKITIPRIGHAESLNAAVAAGIIVSQLSYKMTS